MKLWLISQGENNGYDTYDSAVVAAETEQEAQQTHPWGCEFSDGKWHKDVGTWASSPEKVAVQLIGDAASDVQAGIICASFNAG